MAQCLFVSLGLQRGAAAAPLNMPLSNCSCLLQRCKYCTACCLAATYGLAATLCPAASALHMCDTSPLPSICHPSVNSPPPPRSFWIARPWTHDLSLDQFAELTVFSNGGGADINIDAHRAGELLGCL
jgi:hypothetical protein